MRIRHLAWAGLKRRRGRFAFMLAAVALAIGTVIALVSLAAAMRADVGDELDRFGANIIVTPRSRSLDLAYGGVAVAGLNVDAEELTSADAERIRTIPNRRNVAAVAPKLIGTLEIGSERVLVIGAVFREEQRIKNWWKLDGRLAAGPDEVMLGSEAARRLDRKPGDTVRLGGADRRVAAIIAPNGSLDDEAVLADLGAAQQILGKPGAVSAIEVSALCRGCPIEDIVAQIASVIPHGRVAPVRQAVAVRERAVNQFTRFAYAVSAVVLIVGTLVVLSTMMSAVADRTQEIGILRAIGYRQTHVGRLVMIEALAVNLAGGITGWLLGTVAARILGPVLAQLSTPIAFDVGLAAAAVALAALLGGAGGLAPAMRAARMDPAEALRHF